MLDAPLSEFPARAGTPQPAAAAAVARWAAPGAGEALPAVESTPVHAIMSASVVSFQRDDSLETATRLMLEHGISGAPVVDARGRPVGMVSKTDLIEAWVAHRRDQAEVPPALPALHQGGVSMPLGSGFHLESPSQVTVGDIMVPYLLAVASTSPIALAIALMAYEGVHRLLVLDVDNQMVGIVTALDVLRYVAQLSGFCMPPRTQQQRGESDG